MESDKQIDKYDLFSKRLLVFLETEPQSNIYNQVIFTPEEFRRTSFSIGRVISVDGTDETVQIELSEDEYELPDLEEHE